MTKRYFDILLSENINNIIQDMAIIILIDVMTQYRQMTNFKQSIQLYSSNEMQRRYLISQPWCMKQFNINTLANYKIEG